MADTVDLPDDDPKRHVDRLVAEGALPLAAVHAAERLWQERLRHGVPIPSGELARFERGDLYHVIVDNRIWRHLERIERLLHNVIEIRQAHSGRRRALARWMEGERELIGYAILEDHGRVRTMHVIDARRLARHRAREPLLWKQ